MADDFDVRLERLQNALIAALELLDSYNEEHWIKWIRRCQHSLDAGDRGAFDMILGAYGGMGSFNDLVLQPRRNGLRSAAEIVTGPRTWSAEDRAANDQLHDLRHTIWQEATDLRHSLLKD